MGLANLQYGSQNSRIMFEYFSSLLFSPSLHPCFLFVVGVLFWGEVYVVFWVHFRESAEPIGTFRLLQGAGGALIIINLSVTTILVCTWWKALEEVANKMNLKGAIKGRVIQSNNMRELGSSNNGNSAAAQFQIPCHLRSAVVIPACCQEQQLDWGWCMAHDQ